MIWCLVASRTCHAASKRREENKKEGGKIVDNSSTFLFFIPELAEEEGQTTRRETVYETFFESRHRSREKKGGKKWCKEFQLVVSENKCASLLASLVMRPGSRKLTWKKKKTAVLVMLASFQPAQSEEH